MKINEEYIIPVGGLSLGKHQFKYQVGASFFSAFSTSKIDNCEIDLGISLVKENSMLVIDFSQVGSLTLACDRCSYDMMLPIKGNNRLIVKYGNEAYSEEDDVVIVKDPKAKFDLSQYIYEYIHLQIPPKHVHQDGECNPLVLEKLVELNGSKKDSSVIDPRWEALKNIN